MGERVDERTGGNQEFTAPKPVFVGRTPGLVSYSRVGILGA